MYFKSYINRVLRRGFIKIKSKTATTIQPRTQKTDKNKEDTID